MPALSQKAEAITVKVNHVNMGDMGSKHVKNVTLYFLRLEI